MKLSSILYALVSLGIIVSAPLRAQTGGGVLIITPPGGGGGGGTIPSPGPPVPVGSGPRSELFLTDVRRDRLLSITGTSLTLDVALVSGNERALAVIDTIRTMPSTAGHVGTEYSLAGVPTGSSYDASVGLSGNFFDGTTDGRFNYAWNYYEGAAYRFDLQWGNPIELFSLGVTDGHRLGITFDITNNSLWIAGDADGPAAGMIENRSLTGELLSAFSTGWVNNWALALDPLDGTLWTVNGYRSTATLLLLEQYSRTGTFLGRTTVVTPAQYTAFGGEFAFTGTVVPEPSSALLALSGAGVILLRRRPRKTRD